MKQEVLLTLHIVVLTNSKLKIIDVMKQNTIDASGKATVIKDNFFKLSLKSGPTFSSELLLVMILVL